MGIPFGRYELLKRIAAGGMGEVFLARQAGLEGFEKLLVVKVLLPHLAEDEEFTTMFLDEARIAARLNHPNIGQIYDLGEVDGAYFIAMEYIHGDDVVRLWKTARAKEKFVPLPLAVRIAADAGAGLDYAHKAVDANNRPLNLVHRDVSPQNILVTFDGAVKLIDFGVAKAAGRMSRTATGTLKGKYSYMSPEQAKGMEIDRRSDIFALGVVLYEMATSVRLFKRDTEISTLRAVTDCEIMAPSQINPQVDPLLESVIMKALEPDPEKRYQDAQAFRLALEEWAVETRQSGSSAHLAAFMQDLYADRLAAERAEGKPFSDFEGTPSAIFRRSPLNPGGTVRARPGDRQSGSGPAPAYTQDSGGAAPAPKKSPVIPIVAGLAVLGLVAGLAVTLWPKPVEQAAPVANVRPAIASLSLRTTPPGASVLVNGKPVGTTPLEGHPLPTGEQVKVEAILEGYVPRSRVIQAAGAQSFEWALEKIDAGEQPAAVAEVELTFKSTPPGATVLLDGEAVGKTPVTITRPRSDAKAMLELRLTGYRPVTREVGQGADETVEVPLKKMSGRRSDGLDIKIGR
ncbi:MAG: protein kinase domain-containing protein [Myxococcales bacterium]|jgi:serine/threonine protein kinase